MEYPLPVQQFIDLLRAAFPVGALMVKADETRGKHWWIDLRAKRHLLVEWRPEKGFGFSRFKTPAFGEGPTEVFSTAERAARRVVQVLTRPERKLSSDLAAVRELYGLTQIQLAARLRKGQPAISRLEDGRDSKIETIQDYVRGLGGRVEILAVFPDGFLPIPLPACGRRKYGPSKSAR
jgi:hypothetical protein